VFNYLTSHGSFKPPVNRGIDCVSGDPRSPRCEHTRAGCICSPGSWNHSGWTPAAPPGRAFHFIASRAL